MHKVINHDGIAAGILNTSFTAARPSTWFGRPSSPTTKQCCSC